MSDYVSVKSILLKNRIMEDKVLQDYRNGNLNLQTFQTEYSPLQLIYANTYNYLTYPEVSINEQKLVKPTNVVFSPSPSSSPSS